MSMRHEFRNGVLYVPCEALDGKFSSATAMDGRFTRKDGSTGFNPLFAFADLDCLLLAGSSLRSDADGNLPKPETRKQADSLRCITDEQSFIAQFTGSRNRVVVDESADRQVADESRQQRMERYAEHVAEHADAIALEDRRDDNSCSELQSLFA